MRETHQVDGDIDFHLAKEFRDLRLPLHTHLDKSV